MVQWMKARYILYCLMKKMHCFTGSISRERTVELKYKRESRKLDNTGESFDPTCQKQKKQKLHTHAHKEKYASNVFSLPLDIGGAPLANEAEGNS